MARLVDATVAHLQELRATGQRWVEVDPETLAALSSRPPAAARPRVLPGAPSVARESSARPLAGEAASPAVAPVTDRAPAAPVVVPLQAPSDPAVDKRAAMEEIRARALVCQKCPPLVRSRTQVVFGVGNLDAELMFVGEAPGAEEDRQGEPFVGPAGQLLTKIIKAMGFSRDTVYIANILKCRPDMPAGSFGNRPPRPDEMDICKPYLFSQIDIIRPRVLVALGATAVNGLLGITAPISSVRGRWQSFRGIPVMPTYHPSYLCRAEKEADRGVAQKRKVWEDMLQVLEKLEKPITDRMRGYFLRPAA